MATCSHGTVGCQHAGFLHDEDSCFDGWWRHEYVCQECGHTMKSNKYSVAVRPNGTYIAPEFKPKDCPKCKSEGSFV